MRALLSRRATRYGRKVVVAAVAFDPVAIGTDCEDFAARAAQLAIDEVGRHIAAAGDDGDGYALLREEVRGSAGNSISISSLASNSYLSVISANIVVRPTNMMRNYMKKN